MFQIIQYFKLRNPEYKFIFQITKFKNNFRNFVNKKIVDNFFYINNNNIFFILFQKRIKNEKERHVDEEKLKQSHILYEKIKNKNLLKILKTH